MTPSDTEHQKDLAMARSPFRLISALALAGLLVACTDPADLEVRDGPQAEHPSPSKLARAPLQGQSVPSDLTKQDFVNAIFPHIDTSSDVGAAIKAFADTCLTHSPSPAALAKAAPGAGFTDVERNGKTVFATALNSTSPSSLQVNVASSFTYECGVTAVVDAKNKTNVRATFFNSLGTKHTNGVGQITLRGQSYILSHVVFGSSGLRLREHAFLIQQN